MQILNLNVITNRLQRLFRMTLEFHLTPYLIPRATTSTAIGFSHKVGRHGGLSSIDCICHDGLAQHLLATFYDVVISQKLFFLWKMEGIRVAGCFRMPFSNNIKASCTQRHDSVNETQPFLAKHFRWVDRPLNRMPLIFPWATPLGKGWLACWLEHVCRLEGHKFKTRSCMFIYTLSGCLPSR